MLNKLFFAVALVGVAFLGVIAFHGFGVKVVPAPAGNLGGTINYSNSLGQTNLYNTLASLLGDVAAVRAPLGGVVATSSASFGVVTLGPIGSTTSTASSSITVTSGGAGVLKTGDIVLLGESTTTTGILLVPTVVNSSTLQVLDENLAAGVGVAPATTTLYIWDLPQATFAAPAALVTVTSTSN